MSEHQSWLCVGGPLAGQFHNPGRQDRFTLPITEPRRSPLAVAEEIDPRETVTVTYADYQRQRFMCDGHEISFWVPAYQTARQTLELLLASYELAEGNARSKKK